MKILKLIPLLLILAVVACASAPEGFENAKASAGTARQKALDIGADSHVPSRFGEADSQYTLAQEKEAAGELEEAMDLYERAETTFNVASSEAELKLEVDAYMEELNPLIEEVESRINS